MTNDYILRSDVEKILKLQLELHESSYSELSQEGDKGAIYCINRVLSELSSIQSVDRWIPVTERLPEPRQEVLFLSKGDIKFGYYVKSAHGDTEYWFSGGGYFPGKITHWQPLPPNPSSHV